MDAIIKNAVTTIFESRSAIEDQSEIISEAVRYVFAGIPASGRDEIRKNLYSAIVAKYDSGVTFAQLRLLAKNGDECAAFVLRMYNATAQAYSRLFPSAKKKKGKKVKKASKGIVIPMRKKDLREWLDAAIAAVRDAESLEFDARKMIAALTAVRDIL